MSGSTLREETDDFVTCSVCLNEYDENTRRPKFLRCYHTICLPCLKQIHVNGIICCPLCREEWAFSGDVTNHPTNVSILHILKMKNRREEELCKRMQTTKWCLTCGAGAKLECATNNHSCIKADSLKNFEALLSLKDVVLNLKRQGQSTLSEAIQKRNEIEKYTSLFLETVQTSITQLKQENKRKIAELIPHLQRRSHRQGAGPSSEQEEQGHFIAELITLLDQSTSEDTLESLKDRMAIKYCSLHESELALASDQMTDIKSMLDFFQSWSLRQVKTDGQQKIKADCSSTNGAAALETDAVADLVTTPNLILSLFKSRIYVGEVLIRPISNSPFADFFKQLGGFLSLTPSSDYFSINQEKVVPGVYLLLKFTLKTGLENVRLALERSVIQVLNLSMLDVPQAKKDRDVGFTWIVDRSNQISGWSLLFPLGNFDDPRNAGHIRPALQHAILIGKVFNQDGMDCIRKKATTLKDLTFTLKSDSAN